MSKANKPQTTRGKIYEEVKKEIFSCILQPSEILVVDNLARRFGVSRTPVREALLALSNEGLLETRHHVGFIVAPVNVREIIEIYSLRILLEKEAVRLAASRLTPEDLAKLAALLDNPEKPFGRRFHFIIAHASGWGVLANTIEDLMDKSSRSETLFSKSQALLADKELGRQYSHRKIYEALLVGDGDQAASLMELHLNEAKEYILKAIAMM